MLLHYVRLAEQAMHNGRQQGFAARVVVDLPRSLPDAAAPAQSLTVPIFGDAPSVFCAEG